MLRPLGPLVGLLLLAGCSAGASQTSSTSPAPSAPRASATPPPGAASLAGLGLQHGPADLFLPAELPVTATIDQPNVVVLFLPPSQATPVSRWLGQRLGPAWQVTADRNRSVLWRSAPGAAKPWQGAFTCSAESCALTLRQQ